MSNPTRIDIAAILMQGMLRDYDPGRIYNFKQMAEDAKAGADALLVAMTPCPAMHPQAPLQCELANGHDGMHQVHPNGRFALGVMDDGAFYWWS